MSYEEARQNRKRTRRSQNMSVILSLLSTLGRSLGEQRQVGQQRKWLEERDTLKEQRELERMEREQAFRREESAMNRQNQLDIANTYASRQKGGGLSQWESYGEGVTSQYGDDPETALAELQRQLGEADPMGMDGTYERLMSDRKALLTMRGRERRMQQQGMPQASRTGDLTSGSPSAGANAQSVQGQRNYERTYRALMAAQQGGDPMAYETIRQTYPQLNLPPYAIASPDLFAQGMPQ